MENIVLVRDKKVVFKESFDLCHLKQLVQKHVYDDTKGYPQASCITNCTDPFFKTETVTHTHSTDTQMA